MSDKLVTVKDPVCRALDGTVLAFLYLRRSNGEWNGMFELGKNPREGCSS
jgi:hypothetical protein